MQPSDTDSVSEASAGQRCYLYLLTHREMPYFKVGIATDLKRRFHEIAPGLHGLCIESTQALLLDSQKAARALESTLHLAFDRYRLDARDAWREGLPSNGGSEWFSQSCYARLLDFLLHVEDCFAFEHVPSAEVSALVAAEDEAPTKRRKPSLTQFEKFMLAADQIRAHPFRTCVATN